MYSCDAPNSLKSTVALSLSNLFVSTYVCLCVCVCQTGPARFPLLPRYTVSNQPKPVDAGSAETLSSSLSLFSFKLGWPEGFALFI